MREIFTSKLEGIVQKANKRTLTLTTWLRKLYSMMLA